MKLLRLSVFAVVVTLAACTSSPTSSPRTDARTPSFDGGNTLGSGYNAGAEGPGSTQGVASDTTGTEPQRGGSSMGSGN